MTEEHDRVADSAESELDDMEVRTERLEDEIEDVREDWEHKKQDPAVPGADEDAVWPEGGRPPSDAG